MAEEKQQIHMVPLDKIVVRKNVRTRYDENKIIELAESIKKKGLLQPITVTPSSIYRDRPQEKNNFGGYDILFGHRRYMAYKLLAEKAPVKYGSIPAIVKTDVNEREIVEIQLIENIQRENISAVDLKNSLTELKNRGQTHQQIATQLGKSLGYVKNLFSAIKTINENSDLEQFLEENEKITITDVREVQGLPVREQLRLLKLRAVGTLGSIKQLKEEITNYKKKEARKSKKRGTEEQKAFSKVLYIHSNALISLPGKYTLPEMSKTERKETAKYLRTLADTIDAE